jgi:methyltransferase family protein
MSRRREFLLELLPKHSVCAEIGVWKGDFAREILRATQPLRLHLIDPWKHETGEEYKGAWYGNRLRLNQTDIDAIYGAVCTRFETETRAGRVEIHRGNSSEVLSEFPDGCLDWVYIDGNHLYEFVIRDLDLSFEKTKAGGYIAGDDYRSGGWWQGGVQKAVDEFVERAGVEVVALQNTQFVLRKDVRPRTGD